MLNGPDRSSAPARCTIILSCGPHRASAERNPEEEIAQVLAAATAFTPTGDAGVGRCQVLLVPHLYYLTPAQPAAQRLLAVRGRIVVAACLYPRAARWVLANLGLREDDHRRLSFIDLRLFKSPLQAAQAIREQLESSAGPCCESPAEADATAGLLRVEAAAPPVSVESHTAPLPPRWYPVIDYSRCVGCMQCAEFCLFGVYEARPAGDGGAVEGAEKVLVAKPDNCKTGCPACSRVCPGSAIMFPQYEDDEAIAGSEGFVADQAGAPAAGHGGAAGPATRGGAKGDELDDLINRLELME